MEQPDLGELMGAAIRCIGLSKRFRRHWAVRDLDMTVQDGQIYGFLGPNGAGKTTTIRMLLGLIRPTAGRAEIAARPVGVDGPDGGVRVGALVEVPAFYEYFTGWRNLALLAALSGTVDPQELEWALRAVRLWGRHEEPVSAYSHGMKQRLGIAQALVPRPDILILDEPAQGLDPEGLAQVRDLLRSLAAEGLTIFLSSHLLHEVEQICTHVGVVVAGRLIAEGSVDEMLTGEHTYELDVTDSAAADRILGDMPLVTRYAKTDTDGFEVILAEDRPENLNARLVEAEVGVRSLTPRRTNLEAFYLQLAGTGDEEGERP